MPYIGNKPADTTLVEDNSISTAKIVDSAVTTAKINNDAVTVDKVNLISTSSVPSLEAKGDGSSQDGYIQLNCSQNSHGIKLKSPPHSAGQSYTLTFPSTAPATDKMLQTNSSGVLSFVDAPSGGMTLVANSESSSQVNNLIIDNCFTSTYKQYVAKIIFAPTSNADVWMRYRTGGSSGSTRTNSDHVWLSHSIYKGNSSQGTSEACAYNDDKFKISYDMQSDNDSALTVSTINFYDPNSQQFSRQYWNALSFWQYNSSNRFYGGHFHGMNGSNVDATGFELIPSAGYIGYHSVKVYGLKDS
tara:strand:+ start:410 stop:1315 length:906 start_codon:yes stop_codon:yes gene_type:complete